MRRAGGDGAVLAGAAGRTRHAGAGDSADVKLYAVGTGRRMTSSDAGFGNDSEQRTRERYMTALPRVARASGVDTLKSMLKRDIENLKGGELPLESGTRQGGHVDDRRLSATIFEVDETAQIVQARVGVFFDEVVGGCSCGDDPFTVNAYCELRVRLDKRTGQATFEPITVQDEPR